MSTKTISDLSLRGCKISHVNKFFEKYPIENLDAKDRTTFVYTCKGKTYELNNSTHYKTDSPQTVIVARLLLAVAKHYKINLRFKITNGRYKGSVCRVQIRENYGWSHEVRLIAEGHGFAHSELPTFTWCDDEEEKFVYIPVKKPLDNLKVEINEGDVLLVGRSPAVFMGWDDHSEQMFLNFGSKTVRRSLDADECLLNVSKLNTTQIKASILKKRLSKI